MLNNKYEFCVYSSLSEPTEYNGGDIVPGEYWVECDNYLPLKGNGVYKYFLVQYCLDKKIITKENIKYELKAAYTLPADYFKAFGEHVLSYQKGNQFYGHFKKLFNCMIGGWAIATTIRGKLFYVGAKDEACYQAVKHGCISHEETFEDKTFYSVFKKDNIIKNSSMRPFYDHILDLEAIELHRMKILIEDKHKIIYVNTDQIVFERNENTEDLLKMFLNRKNPDGGNKYSYDPDVIDKVCHKPFLNTTKFELNSKKWSIVNDPGNNDFIGLAKKMIEEKKSFLVNGFAGTGKSYFVKCIQKYLEESDKKYITVAPTNKAARNVDGETLDKFYSNYLITHKANYDYILVDEISMVKEVFYRMMHELQMKNSKLNFIICGDFLQFDPVKDICEGMDYENSIVLFDLCKGNKLSLTTCRRSDKKTFKISLRLAKGENVDMSEFYTNKVYNINLCYHNSYRKKINEAKMKHLIEKSKVKYRFVQKYSGNKQSQDMWIYVGLPLIGCVNDRWLEVFNSVTYKVIEVDDEEVKIQEDDGEMIIVPLKDMTKKFFPAYAVTIHKAQGVTIKGETYCIHEWDELSPTAKYVAFSRASNCRNLKVFHE